MNRKEILKAIVDARDLKKMVGMMESPAPGEYVITGPQMGNNDFDMYVGYAVQIRKKAGAYGSDIVLLRHPSGTLGRHENQCFCRVSEYWEKEIKSLYDSDTAPELEDYTKPYTLGKDFPEIGKIIEARDGQNMPPRNDPPFSITVSHGDGSKTIETII